MHLGILALMILLGFGAKAFYMTFLATPAFKQYMKRGGH